MIEQSAVSFIKKEIDDWRSLERFIEEIQNYPEYLILNYYHSNFYTTLLQTPENE